MSIRTLALVALLAGASSAHAVTVLFDDFNANPVGANLVPAGWTVTTDPAKAGLGTGVGTVDILGPGYFDISGSAGHGNYIDLDGSTNNAGILSRTVQLLANTTYSLTFDLAGSHRNFVETVAVNFGTTTGSYTVSMLDAFASRTLSFTPTTSGAFTLSFENGGGDLEGALLDNVSVASVPEPETYALMLAGIGAVGFMARRRRRAD